LQNEEDTPFYGHMEVEIELGVDRRRGNEFHRKNLDFFVASNGFYGLREV
jgi:hypothetical protein